MTHNTREGIEEKQKVLTSTACCRACYRQRKQLTDEIIKELEQTHHQELQKAREEERERIIKLIDWRGKGFNSGSEVVTWIDKQLDTLNQSKLDQPT